MISYLWSTKLRLLLACALLFSCPLLAHAEIINRVVATVNDDIITLRDLQQEGAPIFKQIRKEAPPMQAEAALRKARQDVLSSLIDKKIVDQRADQLQLTVSSQELDSAFDDMLARRGLDREAFQTELNRMGTTEAQYRLMLRTQILQSKLVNYEVRSKVVITDDKIKEYYDSHYAAAPAGNGLRLLQIGISWDDPAKPRTKEEARQLITELRGKAVAGEDFRQLARSSSDLPSAVDGGDIGSFKQEEMAPDMRDAIADVKPGGISQIMETPNAFQFFMLLTDKDGKAPFEVVKEEIHRQLYSAELERNFKTWVKQLREQADIKELL